MVVGWFSHCVFKGFGVVRKSPVSWTPPQWLRCGSRALLLEVAFEVVSSSGCFWVSGDFWWFVLVCVGLLLRQLFDRHFPDRGGFTPKRLLSSHCTFFCTSLNFQLKAWKICKDSRNKRRPRNQTRRKHEATKT